jgi:hypothetical protein
MGGLGLVLSDVKWDDLQARSLPCLFCLERVWDVGYCTLSHGNMHLELDVFARYDGRGLLIR